MPNHKPLRNALTEKDLQRELDDPRFSKLKPHEAFVAWFLTAFVTEDEHAAIAALTGGSGDKNVDAVLVDERAKVVFVVQGKLREKVGRRGEGREHVRDFATLAEHLCGPADGFSAYAHGLDPHVRERLVEARDRILKRRYRLKLYYVTLGRFSSTIRQEALSVVRRASASAGIDLIGGSEVLRVLRDYLDGVAPPVASLDLEMEGGRGIIVKGVLQRFDDRTGIESWVFPMSAQAVADVFELAGRRLFARNIRGFLGNTEINRGMERTLKSEPQYFWYYNNGITMVCDDAEEIRRGGRELLRVANPQVINGQQTTRVLHRRAREGRSASVLVRVIRVPRDDGRGVSHFDALVSQIVAATNFQNFIRPSDLMSNDRRQVELERQLRKLDYQYIRKRTTKGEARASAGVRYRRMIKKDEVAQASAACDLDPVLVREGKEGLFAENLYPQVFPTTEPLHYLTRYWLMREVAYTARGYPERAYAKWLVLHFVWQRLESHVRSRVVADWFRQECERPGGATVPMERAIDAVFVGALRFFRAKRGVGPRAIDVSTFFKRRGLDARFESFWRSPANQSRRRFNRQWARFQGKALAAARS